MRASRAVLLLSTLLFLVVAPSAPAVGKGTLGSLGASHEGVADGEGSRYVAFPALRGTTVAKLDTSGGQVRRAIRLPGRMAIPAVAYDYSPGGLSADGGTLVLFRQTYTLPGRRSEFAVLDTDRLRLRRWVRLRGGFSFDAISPDGRTLYLVHYLSRRDITDYEVRVFDLRTGRLLPEPIVDPEEPDEQMAGLPITRATSPDGRWEYTLYDGNGKEPFIHALDTAGRSAVCIDLPQLEGRKNLFLLRLDVDPGTGDLTVLTRSPKRWVTTRTPLLTVDAETFEVAPATASGSKPGGDDSEGSPPWLLIGLSVGLVAFTAIVLGTLGNGGARRRAAEVDEGGTSSPPANRG
jgi:hypothetical protein